MLKKVKKTFYVILALVMCINLLPVKAFADEVEDVQVNAENAEAGNEAASDEATLDEKDINDVLEAAESELPAEEKAEEKDEDPDLAPADQADVKKEQLEEKEPEEVESKEELTEEKASEKTDAEVELVEEKTSEKADVKEEPDEENGLGFFRIITLNGEAKTITVTTYSPTLDKDSYDEDHPEYDFYVIEDAF